MLFVLIVLGCIVLAVMLFWAPMRLYSIHKELRTLNEIQRNQTRLLASIVNVLDPAKPDQRQQVPPDGQSLK